MRNLRDGWDRDGCRICFNHFRKNEIVSFVCEEGHAFHFDCYCHGLELRSLIENPRKRASSCPLCRCVVFYGEYSSYRYLPSVGLQFLHPYKLPPPPPRPLTPLPPPPPPPPPSANRNPSSSATTVLSRPRPLSSSATTVLSRPRPPMARHHNDFYSHAVTILPVLGFIVAVILVGQLF